MEPITGCWSSYTLTTSPGDNIQPNCSFMDPSLTFLQFYVNEECTLQVTASEQNKNSQSIYRSGHLTMVKGGLLALQSPTSTNSVETRDSFQTTSLLCCRTVMDGVIDSWVPQLARPDDENKNVRIFSFCFLNMDIACFAAGPRTSLNHRLRCRQHGYSPLDNPLKEKSPTFDKLREANYTRQNLKGLEANSFYFWYVFTAFVFVGWPVVLYWSACKIQVLYWCSCKSNTLFIYRSYIGLL